MIDWSVRHRPAPCGHLEAPAPGHAHDQEPDCDLGYAAGPAMCPTCGDYLAGVSPEERTRCEVWTRVMGYHRPVHAFNAGKQAEHRERRYFKESAAASGEPPADGGDARIGPGYYEDWL